MSRTSTSFRKTFLTFSLISVSCLLLLVSNYSTTTGRGGQDNRPQIINLTTGFHPAGLTDKGGHYILLLKNNYSKNINGYVIGIGARGKVTVDLTIGTHAITPGNVEEQRIPYSNLKASSEGGVPETNITILAVLFEDGTSEGAAPAIAEIKERRAGAKIQLKRMLPLIQGLLTSRGQAKPLTLGQVKEQIALLPEQAEEAMSPQGKQGLHDAKQDVLMSLQELEQGDTELPVGLTRLKDAIEKRIARL